MASGRTGRVITVAETWRSEVADEQFRVGDEVRPYVGMVRRSRRSRVEAVDLRISIPSLRRGELLMRFIVSRPVDVTIHIGDAVERRRFEVAEPTLCTFALDITALTEAESVTRGHVVFRFEQPATVTIIDDDDDLAPRLQITADRRQLVIATAFYVAVATAVVGGVVQLAGILPRFDADTRAFTVLIAVLVFIYGAVELPKPAVLDIARGARKVFARLPSPARGWITVLLIAVAVFIWISAAGVVDALVKRAQYTRIVSDALRGEAKESDLVRAFVLFPWRRDAPLLLEALAYRQLASSSQYRQYLRETFDTEAAREAARKPFKDFDGYLQQDQLAIFEPSAWYVSFLYDVSESEANRVEMIDYLKKVDTDDATVERLRLMLEDAYPAARDAAIAEGVAVADRDANRQAIADLPSSAEVPEIARQALAAGELRANEATAAKRKAFDLADAAADALVKSLREKNPTSFVFQTAADSLGSYYLGVAVRNAACANPAGCSEQECEKIREAVQESERWFERVIFARRNSLQSGFPQPWLRPAEKLLLYHFLVGRASNSEEGRHKADLLRSTDAVVRTAIRDDPATSSLRQRLLEAFPDYSKDETWRIGSSVNPELRTTIETRLLSAGWKY